MSAKDRLDEGYTILVGQDEDALDPRSDDNLGIMVCFHHRLILGDRHDFHNPKEFMDSAEYKKPGTIVLPLYLYNHGLLSISTESFIGRAHHAEWDSGKVGFIYTTAKKIREWYGITRATKGHLERAREMLILEVEYYDKYLRGDFSEYVVRDPDQNILDSGCGYESDEEANRAAMEFLEGLGDEG